MAITALPEATIHLLGSAQVLTTPTSLVKELIDNSLDAKATSIDILISSNTLDKLEVRDNGHGIPQEDLDALGRRGHTSKLRSFEELRSLGGVTLGFRGEALASAVQLGEVSVTTKTDGESVATKVKLKAPGGVEQQTRTSHPVGTTVSVLNFMAKLPVRKKTFENEASKTLAKINQLLHAYALARPSIKFSLKITKGSKGSWSYSPRPSGDIRGAVSQVIGRDAALQCVEKSLVFPDIHTSKIFSESDKDESSRSDTRISKSQSERFTIEAFLPMAGADPSKIGNGQYLSIDARPVSYEKGTMKKIITLFKKYIRNSLAATSGKVKNPFIRLNIKCPVASYDANVEPAKDDVLFGNELLVIEFVARLLKDVYGECTLEPPAPTAGLLAKKLDDFELLLARKLPSAPVSDSILEQSDSNHNSGLFLQPHAAASPPTIEQSENGPTEVDDSASEQAGGRSRKWGFDMSTDYSEEVEGYERRDPKNNFSRRKPALLDDSEMASNSRSDLNPWLIAKLNAPTQRNSQSSPRDVATPIVRTDPPTLHSDLISGTAKYPTPKQRNCQAFRNDDILVLQSSKTALSHGQATSNKILEFPSPGFRRPSLSAESDEELLLPDDSQIHHPARLYQPTDSRTFPGALPMSPPATLASKGPRISRGPNRPFVSPLKSTLSGGATHTSVQTKLPSAFKVPISTNQIMGGSIHDSDLAWAMDFEERKEAATRRRREELRNPEPINNSFESTNKVRPSPHQNRYNAAIASLERGRPLTVNPKDTFKTSLPHEDPRAYLMRRQKSMAAQPVRPGDPPRQLRAKSMKLPMERISRGEELFPLVEVLPTDIRTLKKCTANLLKDDLYVSRGSQIAGLDMNIADSAGILKRLHDTVKTWVASDGGKGCEVEFTCGNLTNAKSLVTA